MNNKRDSSKKKLPESAAKSGSDSDSSGVPPVKLNALLTEIRDTKNQLEHILGSISDGFISLNRNWCYSYVNKKASEYIGIPSDELIGRNVWEIFPALRDEPIYTCLHKAMNEQVPVQFEYFSESLGRWFENRAYPGKDSITVFFIDITARKEAEEENFRIQEQFRILTDSVPALISYVDSTERYRFNNQKYLEWFGVSPEEIYGKTLRDVLGDEAYEAIKESVSKALSGESVAFERELTYKNVGKRNVQVFYVPDFNRDGEVKGFFALVTDVTERKVSGQALRESEERYRILTELSPQAILLGKSDGSLTFCNKHWIDYTGLSLEESADKGWLRAIESEYRDKLLSGLSHSLSTGTLYEIELPLKISSRDEYRWHLIRVVPAGESEQGANRWMSIAVDIHDRKLRAEEREQLLIRERAARAQAEKMNRLKDEFLATVSHELRTPLNAILGWAQMLRSGSVQGAAAQRAFEVIYRNSKSQAQLVEDLLDVSRIISGNLNLDVHETNLISIIREAIDSVRHAIELKMIRLRTVLEPDAAQISADPNRLRQVIWNLLSNASKFTPEGGEIEIHLQRVSNHAQIRITDTGKGIHPEFLPFIFDRFRQYDSSSTRMHGGLGVGLSIVRHLVELHGGTVTAESAGENHGAVFTVILPMKNVHSAVSNETASISLKGSTPPKSEIDGMRVLLVDDESDTLDLIQTVLSKNGALVKTGNSATEALQILQDWEPDVVISDIAMPHQDGYSLIQKIRSEQKFKDLPAIALTAYVRVEERTRALSSGFQVYVPKPVEPRELLSILSDFVHKSR